MKPNILRIIAYIMLIIALFFVDYAFNNPQFSLPWSNTVSYILYAIYLVITAVLFIISSKDNKNGKN